MSIALLSLKSNESNAIVNGRYKCFLENGILYISDGVNKRTINYDELTQLEETLTAMINEKADIEHTHEISEVNDLQTALDNKADAEHTHEIFDVDGLQMILDNKASRNHNHDTEYSVINHDHEIDDIYQEIATEQGGITIYGKKLLSQILQEIEAGASPINHHHVISDVTNLQTTLDGKANSSHTHAINDVTNLQTTLNGKANSSHTHAINDVTNLQTTLDGKASASHTHEFADIYKTITTQQGGSTITTTKSLETILNEREDVINAFIRTKADYVHTHNASQISYSDDKSVKQELDRINSRISKTTTAGTVVDIFDVIFGTALDAGLQYEVTQLQAQIAALQAEIASNGILDLNDDSLEAFDTVSDVTQGSSNFQRLVNGISTWFSRISASLRGYANVTTEVAMPLYGAIVL